MTTTPATCVCGAELDDGRHLVTAADRTYAPERPATTEDPLDRDEPDE